MSVLKIVPLGRQKHEIVFLSNWDKKLGQKHNLSYCPRDRQKHYININFVSVPAGLGGTDVVRKLSHDAVCPLTMANKFCPAEKTFLKLR